MQFLMYKEKIKRNDFMHKYDYYNVSINMFSVIMTIDGSIEI
jgi:hypothetical protein